MQHFKDSATGQYWSLDDDVEVIDTGAALEFRNAVGELLTSIPSTLIPIPEIPAPEPPSLNDLRSSKETEISRAYSAAASALAEGYPDAERETWPVQITESALVLGGSEDATPWIDAAAAARGVSREDLATKIRDMDLQYRQTSGALTGKRQALRDQIQLAETPEAIAAVVWD